MTRRFFNYVVMMALAVMVFCFAGCSKENKEVEETAEEFHNISISDFTTQAEPEKDIIVTGDLNISAFEDTTTNVLDIAENEETSEQVYTEISIVNFLTKFGNDIKFADRNYTNTLYFFIYNNANIMFENSETLYKSDTELLGRVELIENCLFAKCDNDYYKIDCSD